MKRIFFEVRTLPVAVVCAMILITLGCKVAIVKSKKGSGSIVGKETTLDSQHRGILITVGELTQWMKGDVERNRHVRMAEIEPDLAFQAGRFEGFIVGVFDTRSQELLSSHSPPVRSDRLRSVVAAYLREHAEEMKTPGYELVLRGIRKAFVNEEPEEASPSASGERIAFIHGGELKMWMEGENERNKHGTIAALDPGLAFQAGRFEGFVAGVINTRSRELHLQTGVRMSRLRGIVADYLREHSERLREPASDLVFDACCEAFAQANQKHEKIILNKRIILELTLKAEGDKSKLHGIPTMAPLSSNSFTINELSHDEKLDRTSVVGVRQCDLWVSEDCSKIAATLQVEMELTVLQEMPGKLYVKTSAEQQGWVLQACVCSSAELERRRLRQELPEYVVEVGVGDNGNYFLVGRRFPARDGKLLPIGIGLGYWMDSSAKGKVFPLGSDQVVGDPSFLFLYRGDNDVRKLPIWQVNKKHTIRN